MWEIISVQPTFEYVWHNAQMWIRSYTITAWQFIIIIFYRKWSALYWTIPRHGDGLYFTNCTLVPSDAL